MYRKLAALLGLILTMTAINPLSAANAQTSAPGTPAISGLKGATPAKTPDASVSRRQSAEEAEAERAALESFGKAMMRVAQGHEQMKNGQYAAAIAPFEKAIKIGVPVPELAEAYTANKQFPEALQAYDDLIRKGGLSRINDPDIRMKYAILLQKTGHYREAVQQYKIGMAHVTGGILGELPQSVVVNEQNASSVQLLVGAHLAIASYLARNGERDEAAEHCAEATRLKPGFGLSYLCLGHVLNHASPKAREKFSAVVTPFKKRRNGELPTSNSGQKRHFMRWVSGCLFRLLVPERFDLMVFTWHSCARSLASVSGAGCATVFAKRQW